MSHLNGRVLASLLLLNVNNPAAEIGADKSVLSTHGYPGVLDWQ